MCFIISPQAAKEESHGLRAFRIPAYCGVAVPPKLFSLALQSERLVARVKLAKFSGLNSTNDLARPVTTGTLGAVCAVGSRADAPCWWLFKTSASVERDDLSSLGEARPPSFDVVILGWREVARAGFYKEGFVRVPTGFDHYLMLGGSPF